MMYGFSEAATILSEYWDIWKARLWCSTFLMVVVMRVSTVGPIVYPAY